jgi:hypothetical protein
MSVQDPGSVVITDLSQPRPYPVFWWKVSPIKHAETCDGATHERLVQPERGYPNRGVSDTGTGKAYKRPFPSSRSGSLFFSTTHRIRSP